MDEQKIPPFSALPLGKEDPYLSAWGLYGKTDQLGTLNRLTNKVVLEAAKQIKTGHRVSMNWPLDAQRTPFFDRQAFHKEIRPKPPYTVNDDVWTFNSQSSSQWDGLRHFGYQKEAKFYNGVTQEDIHGENCTNVNGIQAWAEKGIVGRGILIDYQAWHQSQADLSPMQTSSIPLSHLQAALHSQGTTPQFGDILLIRSGFMTAFNRLSTSALATRAKEPMAFIGVEQSTEMLQWIWENFSAVAGDQPAFECWPSRQPYYFHEVLLGGWGCPIGELFDLEALARHCAEEKRWEFFVTSEVCHVPGAVASPPNILAIF